MDHVKEVLIVSDSSSKDANCSMLNLEDLALLETYKEGHSTRNGLAFIGNDFLISAFEDKPKIKIWRIGHSSTEFHKVNAPGTVSALAVSRCGRYCVAGIGPSVYVWEVASGNLDAILQFHMQDITCVKFSSDSSHFLTGGKDGMVFVILLTEAIKKRNSPADVVKPEFVWADHINEVTDIHIGIMGIYSRVATASVDRTCRIYDLESGNLLCTVHMNAPLTSVAMDFCEYFLFLGTVEGNIYKINLFNTPYPELQFEDVAEQNAFVGHQKEITSLCVSHGGYFLVSGSRDKQCRIWDISNFNCVRQHNLAGPVTNVMTNQVPPGIKNKDYIPKLCVQNFKKEPIGEDDDPLIYLHPQDLSLFHIGAPDQFFESRVLKCPEDNVGKMMKNDSSVEELSRVNNSMYGFALGDVFANATIGDDDDDDD